MDVLIDFSSSISISFMDVSKHFSHFQCRFFETTEFFKEWNIISVRILVQVSLVLTMRIVNVLNACIFVWLRH